MIRITCVISCGPKATKMKLGKPSRRGTTELHAHRPSNFAKHLVERFSFFFIILRKQDGNVVHGSNFIQPISTKIAGPVRILAIIRNLPMESTIVQYYEN